MNQREYLDGADERLRADGSATETAQLPGGTALLGRQGKFKVQWMLTKLHLFTFVVPVSVVSADALEAFSRDALQFAVEREGKLRGLQNGVAAIAVLVGEQVEPDAAEYARRKIVRGFSTFAWPAAVGLDAGTSHSHKGPVLIGGIYAPWMRKRMTAVLGT